MADEDLIAILQTLATNFVRARFPQERPFDGLAFAAQSGIVVGNMRLDLEEYIGFNAVAAPALRELVTGLWEADSHYSLNTDKTKFEKATISAVLAVLATEPARVVIGDTQLASMRLHIANWWSTQVHDRYFPIPCVLTPYRSNSFSVGPVGFQHIQDFVATRRPQFLDIRFDMATVQFIQEMGKRSAHWIAEVRVAGRELAKAQTVADLSADVALASVQLLHPAIFRNAARITNRAMPIVRMDVSFDNADIYGGVTNLEPGRLMMPDFFEQLIQKSQPFLSSAGRRISTFLNGGGLAQLERSWCDAAMWFHEGVADTLNTVAVAKMETAIEVLLYAESTKGSNQRLTHAFKAFRNKGPKDPIALGLPTVEKLVERIVTARSRTLHGTLSTLDADTEEERQIAQDLAQQLLIAYTMHLDDYIRESGAEDDTDEFLGWIHKKLFP